MTSKDLWPLPKTIGFFLSIWGIHMQSMELVRVTLLEILHLQGFHTLRWWPQMTFDLQQNICMMVYSKFAIGKGFDVILKDSGIDNLTDFWVKTARNKEKFHYRSTYIEIYCTIRLTRWNTPMSQNIKINVFLLHCANFTSFLVRLCRIKLRLKRWLQFDFRTWQLQWLSVQPATYV